MFAVAALACVPDAPDENSLTGPGERGLFVVTLAWDAPTVDAEGHALDDLASFRVYHGTDEELKENPSVFDVGAATSHTVEGLPAGQHYFAVTAVDERGNESVFSEILSVRLGDR